MTGRMVHVLRLVVGTAALAVLLFLGDAEPAAADNCSGLSDCYFVSRSAVTVTVGIGTVAVVLILTPPMTGAEQAVAKLPRPRQKAIFEEEALAAGRDKEFKALAAALRRGAPPEEWADLVKGVSAVDAALGKVPRMTKTGGALTAEAVAATYGSIITQVSDLHDVGHFLAKGGPGARGVVTVHVTVPVSWANRAPVAIGHAFNAGNIDGRVVFVDPQTGVVAATPHDLLTAAGYDPATITAADFVPTHPTFGN